jgi:hypothetical protein
MALLIIRNLAAQAARQRRDARPAVRQAHLSAQNVDELRNLVDARLAHEATDPRDPRIVGLRPLRLAVALGVDPHRTKLDDPEDSPVLPDPLLKVEDRPARIEPESAIAVSGINGRVRPAPGDARGR